MLTGKKPFGGETISESLASVMRDEPDWSGLPKGLSPRWRRLLDRLLVKDPRQRMQAIGEARIVLEEIAANPNETSVASSPPSRTRAGRLGLVPWLLAGVALLALPFVYWKTLPVASSVLELSIVPAGGLKVAEDLGYHPMAISPNGLMVAYTVRIEGQLKLRIRRLNTRQDVEIPGTEGARNLFFSSDSQWVGFFDSRNMYKVSVHGGTPVVITDALQDRLGTWLADGTIVFSREVTEPLYRISESGGTPTAITKLDLEKRERTHRHPCALDGGPWVVFTVQTVESPGGYDDASIDAVSVATGERRHLYKGARRAVWAPGGYLILARGSDLYAAPIDPRNPRLLSDPVPVLSDVSGLAANGSSYFSIAGDGTLAWIPGGEPERTREVGWFDRLGRWTPTPIPPGPYLSLALSADAVRALVLGGPGGGNEDIWLADLRTGGMNQLTSGGRGGPAVWLRDGVSIAHSRPDSSGGERIVVRRLDGAGGEREIATATHPLSLTGLSPDGASVIYSDYGVRDGHIYIGSIDARTPTRSLPVEGGGYEAGGRLSPDGQWLLYVSTKSRREEVYVRHLSGGGSWQVSTGGGGGSRWGRDGREVFFVSREMLMRVPLEIRGGELSVGQPEPLFEPPPSPTEATYRDYDYDPKSDRFLFSRPIRGVADRREIALSLGWSKRLGEKVHPSR